jgi:hypothetical protein
MTNLENIKDKQDAIVESLREMTNKLIDSE